MKNKVYAQLLDLRYLLVEYLMLRNMRCSISKRFI